MVMQSALFRQGGVVYCGLVVVGQACFLSLPSSGQTVVLLVTSVFLKDIRVPPFQQREVFILDSAGLHWDCWKH